MLPAVKSGDNRRKKVCILHMIVQTECVMFICRVDNGEIVLKVLKEYFTRILAFHHH